MTAPCPCPCVDMVLSSVTRDRRNMRAAKLVYRSADAPYGIGNAELSLCVAIRCMCAHEPYLRMHAHSYMYDRYALLATGMR